MLIKRNRYTRGYNKEAKESVEAGKDLSINGKVWICPICGYTHVGENPPDRCPVCGAKDETFKSF
jgi:rubrerythrin